MLDTDSQFSKILENYLSKNINKINTEYQGDVYNYFVTELEKVLLFEVLKNKNGNQLKAAELLGLNRNTLRKKLLNLILVLIDKVIKGENMSGPLSKVKVLNLLE